MEAYIAIEGCSEDDFGGAPPVLYQMFPKNNLIKLVVDPQFKSGEQGKTLELLQVYLEDGQFTVTRS